MDKKSDIDSTHYRITSEDGRRSDVYTKGLFGHRVEVAYHHEDGTTEAYEVDNGILAHFTTWDGRTKKK